MNSDLKQREEVKATGVAPAFFVSHGSPMVALETDAFPQALKAFGEAQAPVRALVVVSAHWETPDAVRVTAAEAPPLIYDFGGFPEPLYRLTYPSPGSPELARDIVARLGSAGLPAEADAARGLDHGTWVPLRLAFPAARIPVVQVSLPWGASAVDVAKMGEVLRPLRAEGVLLMGSGTMTHNLRLLAWRDKSAPVEPWAREFDAWVTERLAARDFVGIQSWMSAPHARLAHPTAEHFLPLFFVLGAALPEDRLTSVFEGFHYATMSMRSFALRG
ncbi:class III extradiol ring-cleavage dioxygenase [Vitiosangium sp. GDMCC 1.1324]|uniref:DODA-type extradiol aromatic ring-opening family dioxygenase n=1 Tax=Vitiosangium sp. (strain GDMCC 1.1324) TaxID=2138576 RepID=UPI000D33A76B|nr:class III extradiol ring-cleavage dioxygenase [Vitiosangium sp. GDMCC 1.1324]PTL83774.1 dioxygenase [Vitiosangium sp. GDMCC 1.1324]